MNIDERIAKRVKLPGRVIIQRTRLSPRELAVLRDRNSYGPITKREEICELEVGDQLLARGKIVRRHGEYYFKVREVQSTADNGEEEKDDR